MEKKIPAWFLPNLLSLDAPIVAVVWAWMFAETWRVQWIDQNIFLLLPCAVWIIYVMDRRIDNKVSNGKRAETSARHAHHEKYWPWFKVALYVVFGFCVAISIQLPIAIFAHAIPILILVCIYYFFAIFSDYREGQPQLTKNLIAAYTFSYGVALGVYFFRPSSQWYELAYSPETVLFGLLCACNITAIDLWEASRATDKVEDKKSYELTLSLPLLVLIGVSFFLAINEDSYARPFFFAIMIAGGLLQTINHYRARFSLSALRVMADAAMIVPAPIFLIYHQGL